MIIQAVKIYYTYSTYDKWIKLEELKDGTINLSRGYGPLTDETYTYKSKNGWFINRWNEFINEFHDKHDYLKGIPSLTVSDIITTVLVDNK